MSVPVYHAERTTAPTAQLGEGAIWHHDALWYCDIPAGRLIRWTPKTETAWECTIDDTLATIAPSQDGMILGTGSGFAFLPQSVLDDPTPAGAALPQILENLFPDAPFRMNDATLDRQGRFLSASMLEPPDPERPEGQVYRLGEAPLLGGFILVNGMAVSPEGDVLYISDSHPSRRTVWRYKYDPNTGMIGERSVLKAFADGEGRPDGATVDAQGRYWIAATDAGRVLRLTPEGDVDALVEVPATHVTKPVLGGADLQTLFITTRVTETSDGAVYAAQIEGPGLASPIAPAIGRA